MNIKRSAQVTAPLLASAALALLTGCRNREMKRCVDAHNAVVDDHFCNAQSPQQQPASSGGGGGAIFPYRWYYGGYGGYGSGSYAGGGGYAPAAGHSYASSTTRGGFGSSFGGGEGGHGGAGE
ncbi:MAG TPA: hypothetical protein VGU46_11430 [Acidobacteriaceae bacterium]|nr:hypothetical protein [Acidobacteriaceae bacterium]